ncbi:hypothetical protein ACMD2_16906 [Ananas comosus]|uniref:Uncharacterized protein n=1 Tax=Ananas comosus TaxID=4615 RepID=A0A199V571_ANACO|nr:hypothetical protein ACMD2_16906 [Ananas comosus]
MRVLSYFAASDAVVHPRRPARVCGGRRRRAREVDARALRARPPQLLGDESDDLLYLVLTLRRAPALSRTNPLLLPLPTPSSPRPSPSPSPSFSVCLFAPTPGGRRRRAGRRRASPSPSPTPSPLRPRSDFKPFEARRRLCASTTSSSRPPRPPLLPASSASPSSARRRTPPSRPLRPGWPLQLRRLLRSTFLYLRSGTCCAVKVGRLYMDPDLVVDNVLAVADAAAPPARKWPTSARSTSRRSIPSPCPSTRSCPSRA